MALNGYKEVLAFAWAYNQENLLAAPVLALLLGLLTFYLRGRSGSPAASLSEPWRPGFIPICNP